MSGVGDGAPLGDLLGQHRADEDERLHTMRATLTRLDGDLGRGLAMIPEDAGTFWHSGAQRAYAQRLGELRRALAQARVCLDDALTSIDRVLARAEFDG